MKQILIALALLLVSFMVGPAYADLDQLCLKQCISSGGSSAGCLPQCEYNITLPAPKQISGSGVPGALTNTMSTHNVMATPQDIGTQVILKPAAPKVVQTSTDYTCLNACLHDARPYEMCKEGCQKMPCDPAAVLCSSASSATMGVMSGAVPSAATSGIQSPHP